jgi:hypothetical protein
MELLYCDETNFEKRPGDFFVYGGLVVPAGKALELSARVDSIRQAMGVPRDYLLKFNPGPAGFTHRQFIDLKRAVVEAAVESGCVLLVNLLLHDIAATSEDARRFGINTLCYHFDCYLNRSKGAGLVLIDRFDDRTIDGQLREKLAVGLTGRLPHSNEMKLKYIVGFHYTAIGQSHFCSLVDVVLGSLRFAINCFTQKATQHLASSNAILQLISPLFLREGQQSVREISLWFSPKEVRKYSYREAYVELGKYLAENGVVPAQAL